MATKPKARECKSNECGTCVSCGKPCDKSKRTERKCLLFTEVKAEAKVEVVEAKKPRSRNAGFDRTNPFCKTTYICSNCGKKTRETGQNESGVGLCAKCFEEAGLENEHSDGYHDEEYHENCPTCQALKAEREAKAKTVETAEATKVCKHCGETKPTAAFYKSKFSKDGYQPSCKVCQNITWRDLK